jgi:nitrite reductase/ring-hydroxylating ferredoxin subunit
MSFSEVAKTNEIKKGTIKPLNVRDREIMVVNYEEDYHAIGRRCTHRGGDLSEGKLEGKIVTCPLHGSKFDITTGKSISGPKMGVLKLKARDLPVYKVKVENNIIWVDI